MMKDARDVAVIVRSQRATRLRAATDPVEPAARGVGPTDDGKEVLRMSHTELTVYGATWCSDCKRAKKFLGEQRVHYDWVDIEQDAAGQALVERVNRGKRV
jgi:hypothetical protein